MEKRLHNWDAYPENVCCGEKEDDDETCDCFYRRRELEDDASRIFDASSIDLMVVEVGRRELVFNSESHPTLEEYLVDDIPKNLTRIFLIPQSYSWGRLSITFNAFRKLCTRVRVYAHFLNVLHAFGEKIEASNDSFSAFRVQKHARSGSKELSYIVKHVEKHDRIREQSQHQWSIRQTGVYHRLDRDGGASMIMLNPSRTFCRRLRRLNASGKLTNSWQVQEVLLSCATQQWKGCLTDLEHRVMTTKKRTQLSRVTESFAVPSSSPATGDDLRIEDAQDLQVLQDYSVQLCQHLDIDRHVLQSVENCGFEQDVDNSTIPLLVAEVEEQLKRVQMILRRVDGLLGLVKSLLDFRCLEMTNRCLEKLKTNGELMNKMTWASRQESEAVLRLTRKASWDTDILKTITFVTLIYLPASFCSSLMDMDYITVRSGHGGFPLIFRPEFYVFLVLTGILWALTLGGYFLWLKSSQPRSGRAKVNGNP